MGGGDGKKKGNKRFLAFWGKNETTAKKGI